jgi:hypothetical protein
MQAPPTPPQPVARPEAEVAGVQRLTESPPPPGILAAQQIPQISMYAFGRGRGAILIAQRYNHQLREHFLQYHAHQAQQQQLYQQHQQQIQQFQEFQQFVNELVDLPELIPIQNNLEDMEDA